jgi:hypothetical protein
MIAHCRLEKAGGCDGPEGIGIMGFYTMLLWDAIYGISPTTPPKPPKGTSLPSRLASPIPSKKTRRNAPDCPYLWILFLNLPEGRCCPVPKPPSKTTSA